MTTHAQMLDLRRSAAQLATVVANIGDDQLAGPTPCEDTNVGELLSHVDGLTVAFRHAAQKRSSDGATPAPSGLEPGWRERLPRQLDALVAAWRAPAAWEGEASAGGVTMPAADMGVVVLDELVLHGWDLARATGQAFQVDPVDADAVLAFTQAVAEAGPEARAGLFGPPVDLPADAPAFDRALGLAGRNPAWTPGSAAA